MARYRTGISKSGQHPFDAAGGADRCWRRSTWRSVCGTRTKAAAFAGGPAGDRNAIPIVHIPHAHVVHTSSRRCRCGSRRCARCALYNVFSIESFMDELARRSGSTIRSIPAEAGDRCPRTRFITSGRKLLVAARGKKAPQGALWLALPVYKNLAAFIGAIAPRPRSTAETGRRAWLGAFAADTTSGRWSIRTG